MYSNINHFASIPIELADYVVLHISMRLPCLCSLLPLTACLDASSAAAIVQHRHEMPVDSPVNREWVGSWRSGSTAGVAQLRRLGRTFVSLGTTVLPPSFSAVGRSRRLRFLDSVVLRQLLKRSRVELALRFDRQHLRSSRRCTFRSRLLPGRFRSVGDTVPTLGVVPLIPSPPAATLTVA
jgi:hypothetical protein